VLTAADAEWVYCHGIATTYDAELMALTNGEPFLDDGVLSYFDGRIWVVFSDPIRPAREATLAQLRRRAADMNTEAILYRGSESLNLRVLREHCFRHVSTERRIPRSAEMLIRCDEVQRCRIFRRAARAPYEARVTETSMPGAQHLRLIERLYESRGLTDFLIEMSFALQAMLRLRNTLMLEAWSGEKLVAFMLVRRPFRDVAVAPLLARNEAFRGAGDFLHAVAIRECGRMGVTYLNLGASPSSGHLFFKTKWHAKPLVAPMQSSLWTRTGLFSGYGPRLVKL
jgi:Phosphatidylglycerol lysyltransferase, C-terminal